jgi:signal transduction histidine kinase
MQHELQDKGTLTVPLPRPPTIRFRTPGLRTLRIVAFAGPVAFAVAIGFTTDVLLEAALPRFVAHVMASGIVATGAFAFTLWMFGVLATVHERLERTARLEERQRIAMRLHDDVIQSTYGVLLRLEAIRDRVRDSDSNEPCLAIEQGIEELNDMVDTVRRHIIQEDLQ